MTPLHRTLALGLFTATLAAAPLAAQAVLRPGTDQRGELKTGDFKLDDNTYADLWRFQGTRGQRVTVTMRSTDFDTFLAIGYSDDAGEWHAVDTNDDGAGGSDSKLVVTLPKDGEFIIRANTLSEGEVGSYTLRLDVGDAAPPAVASTDTPVEAPAGGNPLVSSVPGARMPLVLGAELRGTLSAGDDTIADGSHADIWTYRGSRGETLTMIQRSRSVDSYLTFGPVTDGRWSWEKSDNDGAGGDDSKLVVTLDHDGEYWVRPNALFAGQGDYTLVVTSDRNGPRAAPGADAAPADAGGDLAKQLKGEPSRPAAATPSAAPRRVREIKKEEEKNGELTSDDEDSGDGTFVDTYVFEGRKNQIVIVTMKSEAFRPYLLVGREPRDGDSFTSLETDGAPIGEPAKVTVELPANGRYWIRANTFDKATGRYTLKFRVR